MIKTNLTVEDASKNFKNLSDFVYERIIDSKSYETLSEEDGSKLEKATASILDAANPEIIRAKVLKIMNINILDKNVNFSIFDKLPSLWRTYYLLSQPIAEVGVRV